MTQPNRGWLDHRIPPPVVGIVVAAAMWAVSGIGPAFDWSPTVARWTAGVLVAVGLMFDVLGIVAFRRAATTINPLRPERASALVTGGIYRITRNPMYVGLAFLLLAWAVCLSALLPFAGPVLYVLYITRYQIIPEERVLHERFGDEFARYAEQVRRWL